MAAYYTKAMTPSDAVRNNSCDLLNAELVNIATAFTTCQNNFTKVRYGEIPLPFNVDHSGTSIGDTTGALDAGNLLYYHKLVYSNGSTESITWQVRIPLDAKAGDLVLDFDWIGVSTAAGNVQWKSYYKKYTVGDILGISSATIYNDEVIVAPVTAEKLKQSSIVLNGVSFAAGDLVVVSLYRAAGAGSDNYAADAQVFSAQLRYERDLTI